MTLLEWLTFVAIWTLLTLPVGPNAINCMTTGVSNGTRRALWTVLGIAVAGLAHMTIATLGLGTLLLAYAELYLALKWLGIAYLVWLGVSLWRKSAVAAKLGKREMQPTWHLVRRGFTISMSNPKAILSYMAAFPQFISTNEPLVPQLAIVVPTAIAILILVYAATQRPAKALRGSSHRPLANSSSTGLPAASTS